MTAFKYDVVNRRYGKRFIDQTEIEAETRTEARKLIMDDARRNQPRAARNHDYVPLRDWQIRWIDQ